MDFWKQKAIDRPQDMIIAAMFGWTITRETIEYDSDTREHDCATYPGDKIYGGQKYDAWVIRLNGERKGWAYGRDESYESACAILCDFVEMPQYTTDVNAALELPLPDKVAFYLLYAKGYEAIARIASFNTDEVLVKVIHPHPAMALCEAYKQWKAEVK